MGKFVRKIKSTGNPGNVVFDTAEEAFNAIKEDEQHFDRDTIFELVEVQRPEPEDHIILWRAGNIWKPMSEDLMTETYAKELAARWSGMRRPIEYKAVKVDTSTLAG